MRYLLYIPTGKPYEFQDGHGIDLDLVILNEYLSIEQIIHKIIETHGGYFDFWNKNNLLSSVIYEDFEVIKK